MATYQAVGANPISFVDGNQNQQEIPLSAITFGPNGADASAWPSYTANKDVIDALLKQMSASGVLKPGTQNAPTPSLTITAVTPGAPGNTIMVTFANPKPSAGTVDVTVSTTQVFPGLTLANIGNILGTTSAQATGLVFLEANNNKAPTDGFSGKLAGAPGDDLIVAEPGGDPAGAFTVKATDPTTDADVEAIKVSVSNPPPGTTFALTVTWSKTQAGVTLATLTGGGNPFAMAVNFSGAGTQLPAAGTVTLVGGANATASQAVPAKGTAFSS